MTCGNAWRKETAGRRPDTGGGRRGALFRRTHRSDQIPEERFTRRWAGFATAKVPYTLQRGGPCFQFVERMGERPEDVRYQGFLSTTDRDEVEALTRDFPKRWHVEEFFNAYPSMGWKRGAGRWLAQPEERRCQEERIAPRAGVCR